LPANTVTRPSAGERRARAQTLLGEARERLLEVAKLLDDGQNPTGHQNATAAIVSVDDVRDAINGRFAADLREWADLHGEDAAALEHEANGGEI
jgi:hypothetical protein